jgi:predicted adenylyl cyclase CyaB
MKNIEIEIKLKLDQPEILLNWLKENAELIKETNQIDYYYDPPNKSFIYTSKWDQTKDAHEWLRIRESGKGDSICYKHWYVDEDTGISKYADEVETPIGDKKQVMEIFKRLGFKETSIINKRRKSYHYKKFKFDCDEVEEMGFFVEIEFKGEVEDPMQGKQQIFDFLKNLGITNWKRTKRGYSWIQWNPNSNHYEEN